MTNLHSTNQPLENTKEPESITLRQRQADQIPFFLRTWWLKEFNSTADVTFAEGAAHTGGIWSMYSDPLCDVGNWDLPFGG